MTEFSTTSLEIAGYQGEPVPNTFYRQEGETERLVIVLPGVGYTCQMPLLFYPRQVALERGADVLLVEYGYGTRPEYAELSLPEQLAWLFADACASWAAGTAQRPYRQITLAGKSLGTLAMGYLLSGQELPPDVRAVWLTPLLRHDPLRSEICSWTGPSLFVIGTADQHYDPVLLREVQEANGGEVVVIEGADHGMNVPGDVPASIRALDQIVGAATKYLG